MIITACKFGVIRITKKGMYGGLRGGLFNFDVQYLMSLILSVFDDCLDSGYGGVAGTVTAGISWKFVMSAIKPPSSSSRMEYIITLVSKT